jgi:hypothetical protein
MFNDINEFDLIIDFLEKEKNDTKNELDILNDLEKAEKFIFGENVNLENNINYISPIAVLIDNQKYSKEQFIFNGLEIFKYDEELEPERASRKEKLKKKLYNSANEIETSYKPNFSKEITDYSESFKKEYPSINSELNNDSLYRIINNMFLLKAHYLKYKALINYKHNEPAVEDGELRCFILDYEKFLKYKLEFLEKKIKIIKEIDNENNKIFN